MKKNGIINPELIRALTDLGHFEDVYKRQW